MGFELEHPSTTNQPSHQAARDEARYINKQLPPDSPAKFTRWFTRVLDDAVRVPGTDFRFGLDPILSFFPLAGTTVASTFGTVIIADAVRLRAPVSVLLRMVFNFVLNWALGAIPLIGPFVDAVFKSNRRNLKLLQRSISEREQVRHATMQYWLSVLVIVVVLLAVIISVPIVLLFWLNSQVTGG